MIFLCCFSGYSTTNDLCITTKWLLLPSFKIANSYAGNHATFVYEHTKINICGPIFIYIGNQVVMGGHRFGCKIINIYKPQTSSNTVVIPGSFTACILIEGSRNGISFVSD